MRFTPAICARRSGCRWRASAIIVALLRIALRSPVRVARVLAPLILAVLTVAAGLAACGRRADDSAPGGNAADRRGGLELRTVLRCAPPDGADDRGRAGWAAHLGVFGDRESLHSDRLRAALFLSGSGARGARRDGRAWSLSGAAVCCGADARSRCGRPLRRWRSISAPAPLAGTVAPTRMVWLPGAYHSPQDFLEAGFDARGARARPAARSGIRRCKARASGRSRRARAAAAARSLRRREHSGCRSIWLAGISLGGFLALDYAATHPDRWDGLCLLAPYLGNRMLIAEIAAAPGLAAWQPGPLAQSDEERRIWRFIQAQRARAEAPVSRLRTR